MKYLGKITDPKDLITKEYVDDKALARYGHGTSGWATFAMPYGCWRSITYGDGKFVVVGYYGDTACSTDGINWISSTLPCSTTLWDKVVYGNGKFVTVGMYEEPEEGEEPTEEISSAYSTDGINWTASSLSYGDWTSLTYGDGKYVTCSFYDGVSYSTDGISWTTVYIEGAAEFSSVYYAAGKFILIGLDIENDIPINLYSYDCINWTQFAPSESIPGIVAYGDGKYVGLLSGSNISKYSTDGINWVSSVMPSSCSWSSIAYGSGMFVAIGRDWTNISAYSTDGINWNPLTMHHSLVWESVAYGNGKFVCAVWSYPTSDYLIPFTTLQDKNSNALTCIDNSLNYTTVAPTAANPNGVKICYLSSEPATKYDGWLYLIAEE